MREYDFVHLRGHTDLNGQLRLQTMIAIAG